MPSGREIELKALQEAGQRVEKRMIECMLGFTPCGELKVNDINFIAAMARNYAFEEFGPANKAEAA